MAGRGCGISRSCRAGNLESDRSPWPGVVGLPGESGPGAVCPATQAQPGHRRDPPAVGPAGNRRPVESPAALATAAVRRPRLPDLAAHSRHLDDVARLGPDSPPPSRLAARSSPRSGPVADSGGRLRIVSLAGQRTDRRGPCWGPSNRWETSSSPSMSAVSPKIGCTSPPNSAAMLPNLCGRSRSPAGWHRKPRCRACPTNARAIRCSRETSRQETCWRPATGGCGWEPSQWRFPCNWRD